jgi:hypothetical protein
MQRAVPVLEHRNGADHVAYEEATMAASKLTHTDTRVQSTDRVALYARVSTLHHQDPEMQLIELREYADRRGWTVFKEYVDRGVSGSKDSRPALDELMGTRTNAILT